MAKFKTKRTAKEIQIYVRHFNKHIMFNWIAHTCTPLTAFLSHVSSTPRPLPLPAAAQQGRLELRRRRKELCMRRGRKILQTNKVAEKRNICTQDKAGKLRRRFIKDNIKSREIKMRWHCESI